MIGQQGNPSAEQQNLTRVLEDLVTLVNDVDQRLQNLKLGISQVLPQVAPGLLNTAQSPFTQTGQLGATGAFGHLGQVPQPMNPQMSPFGQMSPPGVATPTGFIPSQGQPTGWPTGVQTGFGVPQAGVTQGTTGIPQTGFTGQAATTPQTGFTGQAPGTPQTGFTGQQVMPSFRPR